MMKANSVYEQLGRKHDGPQPGGSKADRTPVTGSLRGAVKLPPDFDETHGADGGIAEEGWRPRIKFSLDTDVARDHLADRQPFADTRAISSRLPKPVTHRFPLGANRITALRFLFVWAATRRLFPVLSDKCQCRRLRTARKTAPNPAIHA